MLVLHDPTTLLHETVELLGAKLKPALESPERLHSILKALNEQSSGDGSHELRIIKFSESSPEHKELLHGLLSNTHDSGYLTHLRTAHSTWLARELIQEDESVLPECFQVPSTSTSGKRAIQPPNDIFARAGFYAFDMSTGLGKGSWAAIEASANLAVEGARALVERDAQAKGMKSVLALCRPPGHHCTTSKAGGYCYVNNAVVAIDALRRLTKGDGGSWPKVAILDLDFHHGNGTQDAFYTDPSVLYVSIHGMDEYPYYTGFGDEVGSGDGEGFNVNLPLEVGASVDMYLEKVDILVARAVEFGPEFVLVSLGFDTFMLDPLGKFQIDTEDYAKISVRVRRGLKDVPSLILLEGGYVIDRLGMNLLSFLRGWEDGERGERGDNDIS